MGGNADQVFGSPSVAEGYRTYLEPVIFRPWAERLVEFAGADHGEVVLDVAAGTGVVARTVAERSAPGRTVIASDISAEMLAHVRAGERAGGIRTLMCPATALSLPGSSVDLVLCQQGFPFIPDRGAACREMRRVLRPGGRAAVAVWLSGPRLEPFTTYSETLESLGVPEPYPRAYDQSRVAMPADDVAAALAEGGFRDIHVTTDQVALSWPSLDTAALAISGTPYGPAVAALDAAGQRTVLAALRQAMTGPDGRPARHVMTAVLARGAAPGNSRP